LQLAFAEVGEVPLQHPAESTMTLSDRPRPHEAAAVQVDAFPFEGLFYVGPSKESFLLSGLLLRVRHVSGISVDGFIRCGIPFILVI
jgi:hypothetical protein